MVEVSVTRAMCEDQSEMLAVLARSFWPDPLFGYFARDRLHEHLMFPKVFGAMSRDTLPLGETWVARTSGRIVGAALWVPPGKMPRSSRRELALQLRIGRLLLRGRHRRVGMSLLTEVDRRHPTEHHWYLSVLGVDPEFKGTGVGGMLLRSILERADAEGVPVYLETQREENLAYYSRFEFTERDKISVKDSPPVWTMWREPR